MKLKLLSLTACYAKLQSKILENDQLLGTVMLAQEKPLEEKNVKAPKAQMGA